MPNSLNGDGVAASQHLQHVATRALLSQGKTGLFLYIEKWSFRYLTVDSYLSIVNSAKARYIFLQAAGQQRARSDPLPDLSGVAPVPRTS